MKWAQRADKVYITVLLPDAKNPKVNLEPEGVFTFSATAGAENHLYEFKIELNGKVNIEVQAISWLNSLNKFYTTKLHWYYNSKLLFLYFFTLLNFPFNYIFISQESKINIGVRNIFCVLEKEEKKWWNKLLRGEGKPPHYVKVDWDKWVDEDEDNGINYLYS